MGTEQETLDNTKAQLRKGILEYCILLVISKGEIYTSDILNELKQADLLVVEGTIYPLLNRLKSNGILDYKWIESEAGPPRKYYSLTPKGRELLEQLTEAWSSINKSINTLRKKYEKNI